MTKTPVPELPIEQASDALEIAPATDMREGVILRAISGIYLVHADAKEAGGLSQPFSCTLRGNLKKNFTYSTSGSTPRRVTRAKRPYSYDVASIGDRVRFTPIDETEGIIEEILPRRTRFTRSAFRGREQTLVTNLDQLVIVFACAEPNPDLWMVDRWIVAAEANGIEPLIIGNKRDLVDETQFEERFSEYARIGYRVLATSVEQNIGIDALREALRDRISAFTGPSGVGKSSLLNAIQPGLKLATGEIGNVTFKGRHTTTVRELIPLETGGWVADTPGLRQMTMLNLTKEELMACFIEFTPFLATSCRFHNCRHEAEPDCNLKGGVASGAISARRYKSFQTMAKDLKE